MKEYDVVALGELLIDLTQNGCSEQGNPLLEANPGGAPCNVLAMLARFGRRTAFIGKVGRDAFGNQLESALKEVGIDADWLCRDADIPTTLACVHTLTGGDRSFSFYRKPGADMNLKAEEVDPELLRHTKIFCFGSLSMTDPVCREATRFAIAEAKKNGVVLAFDPNLRESLWGNLDCARKEIVYGLENCDILKISDNEIQWLSGKDDFDEGMDWLRQNYHIPLVFLTMGKDGSRAYFNNLRVEEKALMMEKTVDTTGAGDTFWGAALDEVLKKQELDFTAEELRKILIKANAAAALTTTHKGALRVMPLAEEVEKLAKTR